MADLLKYPPVTAFNRPRNLNDVVVSARIDNPVPSGGFKTGSDPRCLLCKHNINREF